MKIPAKRFLALAMATLSLGLASTAANAALIYWTDWTGGDLDPTNPGFRAQGTITTNTSSITVTYTNANGIAGYQSSGGTNYWGASDINSPYTSATVDNRPTTSDIIRLMTAGSQTLRFSQTIANPVFSYVSLNGNGYAFDRDFDILSYGSSSDGNDCGYWGCGTSSKQIVDIGGGVLEYRLIGTGEPHGTLQFKGAFDTVTWRSMSAENWNGFTVGVQGTSAEVFGVPEPATLALFGLGFAGLALSRRRKS